VIGKVAKGAELFNALVYYVSTLVVAGIAFSLLPEENWTQLYKGEFIWRRNFLPTFEKKMIPNRALQNIYSRQRDWQRRIPGKLAYLQWGRFVASYMI
jgi:hypothetical protein